MAQWTTGVETIEDALCIDIKKLKEFGYLNHSNGGRLTWSDSRGIYASIGIYTNFDEYPYYLKIRYDKTTKGQKSERIEYKITFQSKPSNLGKGVVWYFICPITGRKCRKLYLAYDSKKFISRLAYQQLGCPLYYELQRSSKQQYVDNRFWKLLNEIRDIDTKGGLTFTYKGKETKRYKQYQQKQKDLLYFKSRRKPFVLPKSLRALI